MKFKDFLKLKNGLNRKVCWCGLLLKFIKEIYAVYHHVWAKEVAKVYVLLLQSVIEFQRLIFNEFLFRSSQK